MRRVLVTLVCIVGILILIQVTCFAERATLAFELPSKLRSLQDLGMLRRCKELTSTQKTEILLSWYQKELEEPTPKYEGIGGGDITSGYIQAQFIHALISQAELPSLMRVSSDNAARIEIREGINLALLLMGDKTRGPQVAETLQKSQEPYYRELAAKALAYTADDSQISTLEKALSDEFSVPFTGGCLGRVDKTRYPVREAAANSIRLLRTPQFLAEARKRTEWFQARMLQLSPKNEAAMLGNAK